MTLEKTFPRTVLLNKWCLLFTLFLAFLLAMPSTKAAATLEVVAFSCNPDEVVINNQFSCVVTVQNTGDATGTLNTATLYPDATNWLEEISYAETANVNIDSGASAEVVFNGLKGKKSGDNGFSKIMLDDVTDTYVADNAITLNVIDIVVTTSASTSSANSSGTVDVTAQTVVGGNVDVTLTFSVVSGGCSIGDQVASATTNNVARGQTISHTWTVTLGSDDCNYMVTAKASTNPSKTDSSSGSISCSNCGGGSGSSSSSSSSSGGGGGGGGGSSTETQKTKCNDNFDNDNDGLVDLKDPGCESELDDSETDPSICTQEWNCGEWGTCVDYRMTRICVDANACLDQVDKFNQIVKVSLPAEKESCEMEEVVGEEVASSVLPLEQILSPEVTGLEEEITVEESGAVATGLASGQRYEKVEGQWQKVKGPAPYLLWIGAVFVLVLFVVGAVYWFMFKR